MRIFKHLAMLAFIAAAFVLGGCTTVPMGDVKQDASLKTFPAPKPGMASLYIYRNEVFGGAIKLSLVLDGANVGQSGPKTYFHADIAPGRHTVISQSENTETLVFDALAGKRYFVWQEVKMGAFQARTKLNLVSEDVGRRGVQDSALAASSLPPSPSPMPMPRAVSPAAAATSPSSPATMARYRGRWSGSYACAAPAGAGPADTAGPFTMRVSMVVDDALATLHRGNDRYSEDLNGAVQADGYMTLEGQGNPTPSRDRPWTTRFQGRFSSASRFEADGTITSANGKSVRVCNLDLTRSTAP